MPYRFVPAFRAPLAIGGVIVACVVTVSAFTSNPPVIDPAYAGSYTAIDIGAVPVADDIGAIVFKDANTLWVDVDTFQPGAELDAVQVVRGAGGHITGFTGTPTKVANVPFIDGGLQFGPDGVLFYTAFPVNQLGQLKPGSTNPDMLTKLEDLNVPISVGVLTFVPPGFGGIGMLKVSSWYEKKLYTAYLSPDGSGTFTPSTFSTGIPLPPVNWEGMTYIRAGQPLVPVNSILMNADLQQAVYLFEVDANGDPKIATQKHFMDISDPVGMTTDPVTGDILISTEQGPLARHITVVRGFAPVTPPPAWSVTTGKATYSPGEPIVAQFANGQAHATDWVGLYAAGTSNSAYQQWTFVDGTQVGQTGLASGSVAFSQGLPSAGNYEVRFFADNTYALQAHASFTVQSGLPTTSQNPSPPANAITTPLRPTLSWTPGIAAPTHQVYFGTSQSLAAGDLRSTQAGTTFAPGTLAANTTYYWRVDEVNGQGTTTGAVWRFTTATSSNTPTIAANKGAYAPNGPILASFTNASGNSQDWVGLYAAGAPNTSYLDWNYTDNTHNGVAGIVNTGVAFTKGLPAVGTYEARLFFAGTFNVQATTTFIVSATGAAPASVMTTKATYHTGEAITAQFSNGLGRARDWIGLYTAGAADNAYLQWLYVDGTQGGNTGVANGTVTFSSGLPTSGSYEVRFFTNDTYTRQAAGSFIVQP